MLKEIIEGFRLSPQQEHLWLLQQVDKNSVYLVNCTILIEGHIETHSLVTALEHVVNRHEILRTTFNCLPGMNIPVQVINNHHNLIVNQQLGFKYSELPELDKIKAIYQEVNQLHFNFKQGSLLHTYLVTLSANKHMLFISMPALCADSKTLRNFVKELGRCYTACLEDEKLSDEPLQYVDFAEWQNELLEAEYAEIGRKYWQKQDFSKHLNLQINFAHPLVDKKEFLPKVISSKVAPELVAKISAIAQKYDTSVFIFLLACWQVLVWRLTGESKIVVGTSFTGRKYEELKDALGLFAKYLPLQTLLSEGFDFSDILQQVITSVQEMDKWQESFVWEQNFSLDEKTEKIEQLSYFPICFDYEQEPAKYSNKNVSFSIYKQYACIDRFQIKLSCFACDNALITELHYNSAQLQTEDVQRLAEYFHQLVESAINNPQTIISKLEILNERHLQQLLIEFNQKQTSYPQNKCIHQLFEKQVQLTPNNIAVTFAHERLTYAELNARANQLAHYLQTLGVGSEVLVGICVERSLLMVVGILGILKAGGAYVPLDPTYPQERLAFILKDTQTPVLLTQQKLLEVLPVHQAQTVCLDTAWETIAQESKENSPLNENYPENLAYVIYTSGSTGKPKGVQITHRNLVHSTTARIAYYTEPVTNFLLLSSFAFDSSVAGIFWTLCSGAVLHLPQEGLLLEVPKLLELIQKCYISHLLSLPSLYALILEQAKPGQLISLRTVIVAGESCTTELLQSHYKLQPETSLFNEYGPTEATVWSSVHHCRPEYTATQVSIGTPIPNTQIYILDSHLHPVPVGVLGEIYISGEGIARGYLNHPEMTAEKFIPNPFSHNTGTRLYKTGDLARYLSDGNIEFLGRIDNQVKIRGYRVELGEVEALLNQHPKVREAVVVAREETKGDKRLIAYIVSKQESALSINELHGILVEKLPEYMAPSTFILLKELPLTPNGKVNRLALPAPENIRSELLGLFAPPRNKIEEILAKIWADILKVEQVGIHDNFFDLGGHSLLTTQMLAKVQETLQVDVSLRSLLEMPTVAGLAESIEKACTTEANAKVVNLKAEAVLDPTIYPEATGKFVAEPANIFLTGATGFLGAFLLSELIQQTKADIYCLVRSQSIEEAKKKLQSSLEAYAIWNEDFSSRIIPVVGNLSEPLLGLKAEQFELMARQIDVIYHNGAWVHHIYPYAILKQTNVIGTQEVLRLASQIKTKPVHFISSSSVFSSSGDSEVKVIYEQDNFDDSHLPSNGYSQTKWVSEKLVKIAGERGVPICIYRPSRISGHSETGVFNPNDFLYKLIVGCVQLGSAPATDIRENIVPVDYVSKAIVYLSKQKESLRKNFHLVNPQILHSSILIEHIRSLGYQLEQVSYDEWREKLLNITKGSSEHPLYPLVPFFPAINSEEKTVDSSSRFILQFDCQNTFDGLAGTSITCPAIDNQLLSTYFTYLNKKGFFQH
ncbi:MAG: amino acid adenylation domain-containing protein [Calothrix sp. FI2-JRJ7]|jgi:amino acid adenylation domain-containing protein/thioester reductase-like protein|nr:amino acid adenylation domain-containing protein [Calothrix sp. FI2-JRJ7]